LACAYLGFLFVSVIAIWWMVLVGGNPVVSSQTKITYLDGTIADRFRVGQLMLVQHRVCLEKDTTLQFFPGLSGDGSVYYPMHGGVLQAKHGCKDITEGFIIPALPAGNYVFSTIYRFENNLVGRDEFGVFSPISIRIVP
jgi:hypothetical protein